MPAMSTPDQVPAQYRVFSVVPGSCPHHGPGQESEHPGECGQAAALPGLGPPGGEC